MTKTKHSKQYRLSPRATLWRLGILSAGIIIVFNGFIFTKVAMADCVGEELWCGGGMFDRWCNAQNLCGSETCGGRPCYYCTGTIMENCYYDTSIPPDGIPDCSSPRDTGEWCQNTSGNWLTMWCDGTWKKGLVCMGGFCSDLFGADCSPFQCCEVEGDVFCDVTCNGGGGGPGTPDFSVDVVELSKTITQGQSTTFNINVSPVNNYSGTVNLSQTGCPSGASCTFSATADCTGGATASCTFTNNNPNPGASVLTVTNTAGVAAGTYTLTVTGTDTAPEPDLTDSDSSDLIVIAPAPVCAPPAFMSPTGSITRPADNKITLSWAAVPGADWYDVRLDYPPVDGIPKPNNIDPIPAPNCATPLSSNPHYVCENTVTAVYCSGGTCSIPNIPVPISNGPDYWFWLHPRVNTGAWGCTGATSFTLVAPNSPPSVTSVTVTEPDYCSSGPEARVNWACSDPEGDPWSAYQVQIDDTGSSWNSPYTVDTGKISGSGTSYFAGGGVPPWAWDTTYKARVRVWDSKDAVSNWKESSSWKTPKHAYPQVDFSYSPSTDIPAKQPVQFTDLTTFYDGGGGTRTWSWAFCPGSPTSCSPNSSASQNPTSTYNNAGLYTVIETVTDKDGYTCSCTQQGTCQTINIGLPIPCWKEVSPQ